MFTPLAIFLGIAIFMILMSGFRIVRPTHRGFVETLGKPSKFKNPGTVYVLPIFQKFLDVNITETVIPLRNFPVLTKDKIECLIDVDVYYKVSEVEEAVKKILYSIKDYKAQICDHVRAEIYDIILQTDLKSIPYTQFKITHIVKNNLMILSKYYTITRIEFRKLKLPEEIQESMNRIVESENEKIASVKSVEAEKIKIDGITELERKKTESFDENLRLKTQAIQNHNEKVARSQAEAIEMVGKSIEENHTQNKKSLRKMYEEALDSAVKKIVEEKD